MDWHPKCHTSRGQMPHFDRTNATPRTPASVANETLKCRKRNVEVWEQDRMPEGKRKSAFVRLIRVVRVSIVHYCTEANQF